MIESKFGTDSQLLFRDNMQSPENTTRLGGTISGVTYSNGVAIFNGASSITYTKPLNGTYTVRFKFKSLTPSNTIFFDTRQNSGTGYVWFQTTINITPSSGTPYNNGISSAFYSSATREVVVTGISLKGNKMVLGANLVYGAFLTGEIELFEIYKGTLTANEVKSLYNNSKYKNYNPIMELSKWIKGTGTYIEDCEGTGNSIVPLGQKYFQCNTAGAMLFPSKQAYGTWEFSYYKSTGATLNISFVNKEGYPVVNFQNNSGYFFRIDAQWRLLKGNSLTALTYAVAGYVADNTWYRIRITRTSAGVFTSYVKGGSFADWTLVSVSGGAGTNPITEATWTTSKYLAISSYITTGCRVSDIRFYPYIVT